MPPESIFHLFSFRCRQTHFARAAEETGREECVYPLHTQGMTQIGLQSYRSISHKLVHHLVHSLFFGRKQPNRANSTKEEKGEHYAWWRSSRSIFMPRWRRTETRSGLISRISAISFGRNPSTCRMMSTMRYSSSSF